MYRKSGKCSKKWLCTQKASKKTVFFLTQGSPGGRYEKKAAKLFARGTRSLQCCKDEQKRIKKIKIPRGGKINWNHCMFVSPLFTLHFSLLFTLFSSTEHYFGIFSMILSVRLSDTETGPSQRHKISSPKELSQEESSLPNAHPTPMASATRRGKVSGATFPQEYALEKMVRGLKRKPKRWTSETPACAWRGIHCDESGDVENILWSYEDLEGSVDLKHIPATAMRFCASGNGISGTVNLESFSPGSCLHCLRLDDNALSGSLDLTSLPRRIGVVNFSLNHLSGSLSLINLPPDLIELKLGHNYFSGPLTLTELPPNLQWFFLDHNNFEGSVDLHSLPHRMKLIYLHGNKLLSGSVRVEKLPVAVHANLAKIWMGTKISLEWSDSIVFIK